MITLQFLQGTGLDSQLIEWYGGGPRYSHVDTVMPDGTLLGSRLPDGVRVRDAAYTGTQETLKISIPCSDAITASYYAFLNSQLGKPYDCEGILAFVLGRDWSDPESWFCSELVAAGLQQSGYFRFPLASTSNKITPPDLILVLSALTEVK
jgi:uncharacterized protein YycO